MNAEAAEATVADIGQLTSNLLVDRMDTAIGEASSVMGAMMTELIRRSLRGGVLQIGQGLNEFVGERVDATIVEKTPVLENLASEVADRTARSTAAEVAREETIVVARAAEEGDLRLAAQIEQTATSAQNATTEVARGLTGRIQEVEKHAEDLTLEASRGLTTKIEEAEKRACDTARGEMDQRVSELMQRSREAVSALKDRLKAMKAAVAGLDKRLQEEQAARRDADETHRRLLDETKTRFWEELNELRNTNVDLRVRIEELEKPRGLRALLLRLMFWRKR